MSNKCGMLNRINKRPCRNNMVNIYVTGGKKGGALFKCKSISGVDIKSVIGGTKC
jgi:hypothetical protein